MNHTSNKVFIHELSQVQSTEIGEGTRVWQYSIILKRATIGRNCNINCHCLIDNDVILGDNVTIKSGTHVWNHLRIQDNVFVGPNVVFESDSGLASEQASHRRVTLIKRGASIGANSTIAVGITIGRHAMTGIGSVVIHNVPDYALVYGNPAAQHGWVDEKGIKLKKQKQGSWMSEDGAEFQETMEGLIKL